MFCKRTIDAGEMVIEYTGVVIRSVLTDKREQYYESKVCNQCCISLRGDVPQSKGNEYC